MDFHKTNYEVNIVDTGSKTIGLDIDMFLEPLIDDLKTLWDKFIKVYDVYIDEYFTLKTMLLWVINDFLTYGNLSRHETQGYKACPL